jgi:alpha-tubulin suppressor-like RCC1 family protein
VAVSRRPLWIALASLAVVLFMTGSSGGAARAAGDDVRSISMGGGHACVVKTDGSAWCWGYAYQGQLGDGTSGDAQNHRLTPVRVLQGTGFLTDVKSISAGSNNTCAVKVNGSAWCWGDGDYGANGDGTKGDRYSAVRVKRSGGGSLTHVVAIAASGGEHACALRKDGTVWCWGYAALGQTGDGTNGDAQGLRLKAVQVRRVSGFLTGITSVSSGPEYHSCARRNDGTAWCWGFDDHGQLGDGTTGDPVTHGRSNAVLVKQGSGAMTGVRSVSAGEGHSCAVKTDRTVWCWGDDADGALGDGTTGDPTTHDRLSPVKVKKTGGGTLTKITAVSAGGDGRDHTCARRGDATAWCWGRGGYGQLGDATTGDAQLRRTKAVQVVHGAGFLTKVRSISVGERASCAVRTNDTAWCWGRNFDGELGTGTNDSDPHAVPERVIFP